MNSARNVAVFAIALLLSFGQAVAMQASAVPTRIFHGPSTLEKTSFLLVRHGQTDWNAERIVHGQKDVPLNELGRTQAAALAERLKTFPITSVYSSDLERATVTAQAVASLLGKEVTVYPQLRELQCGLVEGLPREMRKYSYSVWKDKLDALYPAPEQRWQFPDWPCGETKVALLKRVVSCLSSIAQENRGQTVVVVTHSGVIDTLLASISSYHFTLPHCSVAEFEYDHKTSRFHFVKIEDLNGQELQPESETSAHT